jgi:hypothetical protein
VLPGVFVAGRAAMAEALGWAQRDFDAASTETQDAGMAVYDSKTHLWFLPKALAHNPPASPNVVRSWRACLAILPECQLRERIVRELRAELAQESGAWIEAFDEALGLVPPMRSPNPSGKASPMPLVKASPKTLVKPSPNQEQEQEQEQQQQSVPPSLRSGVPPQHSSAISAPAGASSTAQAQSTATPAIEEPKVKAPAKGKKLGIPPCPYDEIVKAYHEALPELPSVRVMDAQRESAIKRTWSWVFMSKKTDGTPRATTSDEAIAWFRSYFELARSSDFLMGRARRAPGHEGWKCTLDYLMSSKGLKHVVESLQ